MRVINKKRGVFLISKMWFFDRSFNLKNVNVGKKAVVSSWSAIKLSKILLKNKTTSSSSSTPFSQLFFPFLRKKSWSALFKESQRFFGEDFCRQGFHRQKEVFFLCFPFFLLFSYFSYFLIFLFFLFFEFFQIFPFSYLSYFGGSS